MLKNNKRTIIIILFYLFLFAIFYFVNNSDSDSSIKNKLSFSSSENSDEDDIVIDSKVENERTEEVEDIYIHISGQVNYPGLLKLKKGQRLYEAIELAGGMTEHADIDQINLSLVLNDQDKVYIPSIGEISKFLETNNNTEIININTATKEQLMMLSGIGEKTADSIIQYREENVFTKIEDLMNVPGIGETKFKKIEKNITI